VRLALESPAASGRGAPAPRDVIAALGLEPFAGARVRELSTGTRRLAELACVLALTPRVLLLDEPSAGLAQPEAEALGPLLLRIRDELGTTLVVVEHDLALVERTAERVIVMSAGAIRADGPPAQAFAGVPA
jgi:ABC-type branched-subunit amino acid transport system ATPase component